LMEISSELKRSQNENVFQSSKYEQHLKSLGEKLDKSNQKKFESKNADYCFR